MSNQLDFRSERVSTLFRKMFVPTLFGMLAMSAVTMIDGIFVGHGVGSDGIAAVNICVPLLMFIQGIGLMAGAGCSVMASISLSQGRQHEARAFVTSAMLFITLLVTAILTVIFAAPDSVSFLLGSSEHLLPLVKDYLLWFAPSLLFNVWLAVALFVVRLDGAPRLAMWCNVLNAVINAVLDWLFIFPLGWGVKGAALATSIACFVGAAVAVYYLIFDAKDVRLYLPNVTWRRIKIWGRHVAEQCKIGFSALLGEVAMALMFFVGNHVFMHYLGDNGVGAFGISCYYLPFVFMMGNAAAQSAQPIISFNFGLGDFARARQTRSIALLAAVACGALTTLFFVFAPKWLIMLFLPIGTPTAALAIYGFPLYAVAFVPMVVNLVVIGYYQSIERVRPAIFYSLLRAVVFLVPCFLLLPQALDVAGIWLALPLSELLTTTTILLTGLYHRSKNRAF